MRPAIALADDPVATRYNSESHAEGMLVTPRPRDGREETYALTGSATGADAWSWGDDVELEMTLRLIPTADWDAKLKPIVCAGMRGRLIRVWPDRDGQPSASYDCYLTEPEPGRYGEREPNGRKLLSMRLRSSDGSWIPLYG